MTVSQTPEQAARAWIEKLDSDAHWARTDEIRAHAFRQKSILEGLISAAQLAGAAAPAVDKHALEAQLLIDLRLIGSVWRQWSAEDLARFVAHHAAAGVTAQPVIDETAVAKVIESASMDYNLSDRSGESYACGAPDYRSAFIARAVAAFIKGGAR